MKQPTAFLIKLMKTIVLQFQHQVIGPQKVVKKVLTNELNIRADISK